ncbi:LPS export ABC transporter permease LptG [Oceanisphaera psychrotolerans]|uniref:Lipopolysaccharide ABC transporter permease LptG n=1 Tax=Oceanisphaera psychrotolerans TaxID=1414654 RepID=A0A1J4QG53_9GAMM|nr:LPS export ABC transporter permease LptG [Oceanisphaera psychrotolerans]OIN10004.1 lipopolysaccharide ABC transporter permease LptG [Oceanisphaera psychrotolerans]
MLTILDRYIGRTVLMSMLLCELTLVGLSAIIRYVEQLRSVGEGSYTLLSAFYYVLLSMPKEIVLFFPIAALLGGLIGLGQLASSSELVVMQASGSSRFNIVTSALKTALPLMLIIMLVGEYVVPATKLAADDLRTQSRSNGQVVLSVNGVWAKDGESYINIGQARRDGTLSNITLYYFDDDMRLDRITQAASALYRDQQWQLNDVTDTLFDTGVSIDTEQYASRAWHSSLTPEKLGVVAIDPDELPMRGLWEYKGYLEDNGQDGSLYELEFWRKALQPVMVIAMMLLASSFVFGALRSVTMGARILMGILFGFGFYVANEVFGPISLVYDVPPVLGAMGPSLLFIGVALFLLNRRA